MTPCISQHIREGEMCSVSKREHHANLEHRDGKTHIIKKARKFICNDIAMIDLDLLSYPTTQYD